jgi:hypothetical protein
MRQKRKIHLVEDFQPRSIDVRELHYARLLGERTVAIRSVKFHHPWLSGLQADRYCIRLHFTPGSEWQGVLLQWRQLAAMAGEPMGPRLSKGVGGYGVAQMQQCSVCFPGASQLRPTQLLPQSYQ